MPKHKRNQKQVIFYYIMGTYSKFHNYTYQEIKRHFPHYSIRENVRPDWLISSNLTKLELDIYIEELGIALEIQGRQHYEFVPYFHQTYDNYLAQVKRDKQKKDLCYGKGIRLIEILSRMDVKVFIAELKEIDRPENEPKFSYADPGIDVYEVYTTKKKLLEEKKRKNVIKRYEKKIRKGYIPINTDNGEVLRLPGSQSQRSKARKLLCRQVTDSSWDVWGGSRNHTVTQKEGRLACDCIGTICTHVIRVMIYKGEME